MPMTLATIFDIPKKYHRLWWQMTVTKVMFSIVPLFLLTVAVYYHFSTSYRAKVLESMATLVQNRQGALDLFFDERIAQLTTLAHTHTLEQVSNEDYLNRIFNIIQSRSKSYIDLGVIDDNGDHLAYVGPYYSILKGVNYKDEEWFNATLNLGVYISDVFLGFRKVPHFIIAVLVRERNRSWILRATIDSDVIQNIVTAAQIGKSGDAFLINSENLLQTKPRFGGNLLERPNAPDFSAVVGTRVEQIVFQGRPTLFGVTQIRSKKWILVVSEDPSEPLAPLLRAKTLLAGLSMVAFLLIVVGSIMTTNKMIGHLVQSDLEKARSDEIMLHESKLAALGKLAAGVAHEINNPLAVIAEEAGWMKDLLKEEDIANSPNFAEFQESLNKIQYHVERVKKVTHRLLGFARRMEPAQEKVMINQVLEDVVGFLENEARYRNISIIKELAPDLPIIISDTSQLQQVFLNILNNAIDAIGKNGTITLRTAYHPESQRVEISISDTGPGIPKELQDKVFDPFFTTKEVGQGTGLGLSISHSIVEKLGGSITLESEVGRGTTFTISLPAK